MDSLEKMEKTAKLRKLFPNNPEVGFRLQHVYGRTAAFMRFELSFDVTVVRTILVKSALMSLRSMVDDMIKSMPEESEGLEDAL